MLCGSMLLVDKRTLVADHDDDDDMMHTCMCVCYLLGEHASAHADCIAPKRNYFNDPKAPQRLVFDRQLVLCIRADVVHAVPASLLIWQAFFARFVFGSTFHPIFCTPPFCEFRFVIVFCAIRSCRVHLRHKHACARDDGVFGLNALNALDRCRRLMQHSAALQMIKCILWCWGCQYRIVHYSRSIIAVNQEADCFFGAVWVLVNVNITR